MIKKKIPHLKNSSQNKRYDGTWALPPISGLGQASEVSGSSGRGKQAPFKAAWRNKDYPISRRWSLTGCRLRGRTELDTTEAT